MKIGSKNLKKSPQKLQNLKKNSQLFFVFYMFQDLCNKKKFFFKFLVQNLQYTKNLEFFSFPGCWSMKMMPICIGSGLYKHGWIHLKFGVWVGIGHGIMENKNRVTG